METDSIYGEKIHSRWVILFFVVIFGFILVLIYLILADISPMPLLFELILAFILVLVVVTINFIRLTIRITPQNISMAFGIFRHTIPWENIDNCFLDQSSAMAYGGWGIHLIRVDGKWRQGYTLGSPRVVLSLVEGRFRELSFTTKNPEKVMELINEQLEGLK
jgi:hypothetical protein